MQINNITKDKHIKDYFFVLRRRKWIVISFLFITCTTVTIATFMQKPIYEAVSTITVDLQSPNVVSVNDVVNLGERNWWAYRDYIETQREIARSRRTASEVMKHLNLLNEEGLKEKGDPISTLLEKLEVELVRDTRIMKIHIYEEDPERASLIANEFAKVYTEANMNLKIDPSREAHSLLKEEV